MSSLPPAELASLRQAAEAAKRQMETGPKEWPGRPSAQRLALFLAATPDVVLWLVNAVEKRQAGRRKPPLVSPGQGSLF